MEHFSPDLISKEVAAPRAAPAEGVLPSRPRTWFFAAGVLVVVLLAANGRLLRGKAYPQWDAVDFFGPAYSLVADHVRAHRLLTWDPWTSGGTPDFAEPELGSNSPVLLLVAAVFPKPSGFIAYWMLIWIAGALGMLVFAKHLRCPPWGALVAALGFAASGFFIGHAQHTSSLFSIAFLPWIFWRLDDALLRERYWSAVQAGALYGLSALGGYPQFTILTPGFLGLWAVGRIFFSDTMDETHAPTSKIRRSRLLPAIAILLLVGVIGGLIFCPPYAEFMTETHGYSDRIGPRTRVESVSSNLLPAGATTTLASPYLFLLSFPGLPGRMWPTSDISMSNIYSGAVVMVLGIFALLHRSRWRYWLGLVVLFYMCCSYGNQLPLRGWVYDYAPMTRYFRNASMFSVYSIFLMCVLAALAARDIDGVVELPSAEARKFLAVGLVAASAAVISFFLVTRQALMLPFGFHLAVLHLAIVWVGIASAGLLAVFHRSSIRRFVQTLVAIAILDAFLGILIAAPALYSSATTAQWHEMDNKHVANLELRSQEFFRQLNSSAVGTVPHAPNNRNIPPKIAVLDSYAPLRNRFLTSMVADPMLQQVALRKSRTWFSAQALELAPSDSVYEKFADDAHRRHSPVLILHSPEQMKRLSFSKAASPDDSEEAAAAVVPLDQVESASLATVDLVSYFPASLQFHYQAPKAGWLMITDRWAPGWTVKVNGKSQPVQGADFVFRAVRVEPGDNFVQFRYRPRQWLYLLIVSWGTLLVVGICQLLISARPYWAGKPLHSA